MADEYHVVAHIEWETIDEVTGLLRREGIGFRCAKFSDCRWIRVRRPTWQYIPETPTTPLSVRERDTEQALDLLNQWQLARAARFRAHTNRIRVAFAGAALLAAASTALLWLFLRDIEKAIIYTVCGGLLILVVAQNWPPWDTGPKGDS